MRRWSPVVIIASLTILTSGTAHSQDAPVDSVRHEPAAGTDPGARAARIGVGATLVPLVAGAVLLGATDDDAAGLFTMYGAALLGPAIGNWSGGLVGRGFAGLAIRSALAAGALFGPFVICPGLDECGQAASIGAVAAFIGGNVLLLAHVAADLGGLPKAVRRDRAGVAVTPVWHPPTRAVGLGVRVAF